MKTESVGISRMTRLRLREVKALESVLLIEEYNGKPLAALVPYAYYLDMQSKVILAEAALNERTSEPV